MLGHPISRRVILCVCHICVSSLNFALTFRRDDFNAQHEGAQLFRDDVRDARTVYRMRSGARKSIFTIRMPDTGRRVFGASMRGRCTRNLEFARCNNRRALRDIPHVRGFIIRIGQTAAAAAAAASTVMAGVGLVNSLAAISRLIPSFRDASAFQKNYAYVRHL